jgi:hypothetical protein
VPGRPGDFLPTEPLESSPLAGPVDSLIPVRLLDMADAPEEATDIARIRKSRDRRMVAAGALASATLAVGLGLLKPNATRETPRAAGAAANLTTTVVDSLSASHRISPRPELAALPVPVSSAEPAKKVETPAPVTPAAGASVLVTTPPVAPAPRKAEAPLASPAVQAGVRTRKRKAVGEDHSPPTASFPD